MRGLLVLSVYFCNCTRAPNTPHLLGKQEIVDEFLVLLHRVEPRERAESSHQLAVLLKRQKKRAKERTATNTRDKKTHTHKNVLIRKRGKAIHHQHLQQNTTSTFLRITTITKYRP